MSGLREQLERWVGSDIPVGAPMRAFDEGRAAPLWSERELTVMRDMGIEPDAAARTASGADKRNWNGVRAVLRLALARQPEEGNER